MKYAITDVRIIDGTGAAPIENGYLIVDGDTVAAVESGTLSNFDGEVKSHAGKTVMPGLINCHCHLIGYNGRLSQNERHAEPKRWEGYRTVLAMREALLSGVTYVRDCGSQLGGNVEVREAVRKGILFGPDVVACGQLITMTGGHGCRDGNVADGVEEVRKAARTQIQSGVDMLKIVASGGMLSGTNPGVVQYDVEELAVAVHEAAKVNKKVTTHCHGTQAIKNAAKAGIQCIEHGMFLDEEGLEMLVKQGTYLVPTLTAIYWIVNGDHVPIPQNSKDIAKMALERAYKSFEMARKAGVRIAMGTDAGTPCNYHGAAWKELMLYVEQGMPPMDAILTTTKTAAELLEIDKRYGTLAPGKNADFLILDANPLQEIHTLGRAKQVYKNGKLMPAE